MSGQYPDDKVTLSGKPPEPGYEHGPAPAPVDLETGMHRDYWVLPPEERAKGIVRPVRRSYRHARCDTVTTMGQALAETYARNPAFYGATMCVTCKSHFPVGLYGEFTWEPDGSKVGT